MSEAQQSIERSGREIIVRAKRDKHTALKAQIVRAKRDKNTLLKDYRRCDVFGFGEIEFLTDLGLALVDGLETLTSEHVNLFGGEIRFE